jgi:7-cyano-7-deazaguanine synthase
MWIDKAQTWKLAEDLGGDDLIDLIVSDTHTCYLGDRSRRHAWGHGCGECPACCLRAAGFQRYRAETPQSKVARDRARGSLEAGRLEQVP